MPSSRSLVPNSLCLRLRLAVAAGADSWRGDHNGATALHYAARAGHVSTLSALLSHQSADQSHIRWGPILQCHNLSCEATTQTIILKNINPNPSNLDGFTLCQDWSANVKSPE